MPLRTIKEVLSQQGGREQLTLCEALSQLVTPQRAAAVAAEYPSMAALIEALNARWVIGNVSSNTKHQYF